MRGQRPIDRYVRIRLTIINKQYTANHQRLMNEKAHKLWESFTWDSKVKAMEKLMERLRVSKK